MMKNKQKYLSPVSSVLSIQGASVLAGSGITSIFGDGGALPGWDNGNTTSSFNNGGGLPGFD